MNRVIWVTVGIFVAIVIFIVFPRSWTMIVSFVKGVWDVIGGWLKPFGVQANDFGYGYGVR